MTPSPTYSETEQKTKRFGPLSHYDYEVLDKECVCMICEDYRKVVAAFQIASQAVGGHTPGCQCTLCKHKYSLLTSYKGATIRRDTYCENSYHAAHNESLGRRFMAWFTDQMSGKTMGWWANSGSEMPLANWFMKFRASSFTMALSGG